MAINRLILHRLGGQGAEENQPGSFRRPNQVKKQAGTCKWQRNYSPAPSA
jgi:hypothetical protein